MPDEKFNQRTDWLETRSQSWAFNGNSFPSPPTEIEIGLHNDDPTNSGKENEVDSIDYERATIDLSDLHTTGNNPRETVNATNITFKEAETNWGTITHATIWHPEEDEPMYWAEINEERIINENEIYEIRENDLIIRDY